MWEWEKSDATIGITVSPCYRNTLRSATRESSTLWGYHESKCRYEEHRWVTPQEALPREPPSVPPKLSVPTSQNSSMQVAILNIDTTRSTGIALFWWSQIRDRDRNHKSYNLTMKITILTTLPCSVKKDLRHKNSQALSVWMLLREKKQFVFFFNIDVKWFENNRWLWLIMI